MVEAVTSSLSIPVKVPSSRETVAKGIAEILTLISKPDALKILSLAREGLRSKTGTPSEVGLTKKQYYTRLRQLVDLNLVEKMEMSERKKGADRAPVYTTTLFGNLVHKR